MVIPAALIDEVLINRGDAGRTSQRVVATMLRELAKLRTHWVDDEINWIHEELVCGVSRKLKPISPAFFKKVCTDSSPNSAAYTEFIAYRKALVKQGVRDIVDSQNLAADFFRLNDSGRWERDELGRDFCVVTNAKDFYRTFMLPGIELREKHPKLWTEFLGSLTEQMRARFPLDATRINQALKCLSSAKVSECEALRSTLLTRQFYFWAPLVKIGGVQSKYIISRSERSQFGNYMDQRYLAMSLPCDALITKDEELADAGRFFSEIDMWKGQSILFRDGDICSQVSRLEIPEKVSQPN